MNIFHIIVVVSLIATVLTCDETTNYMKNGECCKKCEPGTKMKDEFQPCDKPKCDPCGDGEYMPNYNSDTKCKIQPNCDGNLNFIIEDPGSKTEVGKCVCKEGYHCSSEDCVTCAKHTECEVGEGVQRPGTKDRDTECESCLNESFSNITSAVEKCLKWTECTGDSVEIKAGTPISDRVCGWSHRRAVSIIIPIILLLVAGAIMVYLLKNGHLRKLYETKCRHHHEHLEPADHFLPETPDTDARSPVQEDLPQSPQMTENHRLVAQEQGKDANLSQQVSQNTQC